VIQQTEQYLYQFYVNCVCCVYFSYCRYIVYIVYFELPTVMDNVVAPDSFCMELMTSEHSEFTNVLGV